MSIKLLDIASLSKTVGLLDGVLVLRPVAREMFEKSKSINEEVIPGDVVFCDLSGIQDCSSSFVDEFILGWQRLICARQNVMFVLANMNEDVQYTVEAALNQRNRLSKESLSLIAYSKGHYTVLGNKLERNALEVFALMTEGSHISAREVADKFDLELNSAGNRLKKLYDARVVMRFEQSADAGGKFEYYLPDIK